MLHHTLQGTHYEIGLQLGLDLARQGIYLLDQVPFPITRERLDFAQACLPHYRRFFPAALEELRGLSLGQNCPFEALAGVLFSMYCMIPQPVHCSCFALRTEAGALFGRNSDFLICLEKQNSNCLFRFTDGGYSFNGNTTAFVEMEDGINCRGLAVGLTSVAYVRPRPGLNAGMILRLLLESCANVPQALELLQRLPAASSHTLVLADRQGRVALAECCPDHTAIQAPTQPDSFVCATNAFHLPEMEPYHCPVEDDWQAEERYQTLLWALSDPSTQKGLSFAWRLLGGKLGFLCQYARKLGRDTVWSVAYDAGSGALWRAEGNPGRVPYIQDQRMDMG